MEKASSSFFILLLASMTVSGSFCLEGDGGEGKTTYIVIMDKASKPESFAGEGSDWFRASLNSVSASANMVYTYKHAVHGFAADLTEEEAELLSLSPGVTGVVKQKMYHLHTTRTPKFLGLTSDKGKDLPMDDTSDVIIGVVDSGVWPYGDSFRDEGLAPVPSRWKGGCTAGMESVCNRKLVGAKYFAEAAKSNKEFKDVLSFLDFDGHGTHTISTAAGTEVRNSSFMGFAEGTARGMATTARVAAYKVCWGGCYNADILAAIEEAINDGVDILSLSLGSSEPSELADDITALGLLHATAKGILVVMSAGNAGPDAQTVDNTAPWITTVAASTLDRGFPVEVKLGNGKILTGTSLFRGNPLPANLPIILAKKVSMNTTSGEFCFDGNLNVNLTKGKIVVCQRGLTTRVSKGVAVKNAGGAGMILCNGPAEGEELTADSHVLPSAAIGFISSQEVLKYALTNRKPTASIGTPTTVLGVKSAPVMAAFSSRGPSMVNGGVVKPDLTAPGVNILAAWTALAPAAEFHSAEFKIISGTSMSCPHVGGLAALVKAKYPDWSPAAIRSALMTTAYYKHADGSKIIDAATSKPATPFVMGSGHVDIVQALNPGLVYDAAVDDYFKFICAMKLNPTRLLAQVNFPTNFRCSPKNTYTVGDLNYPSFSVPFPAKSGGARKVIVVKQTRTLTSVVNGSSTYRARVSQVAPGASVKISVKPSSLRFQRIYEKRSFTVTFTATAGHTSNASFARLEWTDGKHTVGSPIAMLWS